MITVSIINVTSYTGLELLRLIAQHPQFRITSVTGRSAAGKRLADVFPHLHMATTANINPTMRIADEPELSELAFVCLPHAAAAESVQSLLARGSKVIDLSADFRLQDASVYEEWYRHVHPAPALLETAVYGLCERYAERIKEASLVANPGCYATAAILGLLPAVAAGSITSGIIIDAKSGTSGAGRSPTQGTHYAEVNEDVGAYSLDGHRHLPEIIQELEAAAREGGQPIQQPLRITFVPHLMPMTRGILATCYANLNATGTSSISTTAQARSLYKTYYEDQPFVRVVDTPPHTKWTYGSNFCCIYPMVDTRTNRLIVISCLDNLVKGAAGQAIQNANRLYGLPETAGLTSLALYP
ncbi:MAG: N-acetyl-gamma-glutamyl-phosphate reductase [Chloroflexota bacterium]|nr:N-acetyl-gamma-glutamyl-phosphate reductase [Chloroflexota bacterium]